MIHLRASEAELWLVKKGGEMTSFDGEMTSFDTNELLGQLNCLADLQFQIATAILNFSLRN